MGFWMFSENVWKASTVKPWLTRSSLEHRGSPCDGSVKSAGLSVGILSHKLRSNRAHKTKCLQQDVGRTSEV